MAFRIGPFTFGRGSSADYQPGQDPAAVYDPTSKDPVADRELGAAGTINYQGWLEHAEYNPDLRGREGIKTIDRMFRSDPAVQEAFGHIAYPIRNAAWYVEDASDDPKDKEIGEFVRRAYFEWLDDPFQDFLTQVCRYLRYGHALFEHTWKTVDSEIEFTDPDDPDQTITVPLRQFLTFKRFAPRLPYTLWKWHAKDGELVSVVQRVWKDDTYLNVEIPAEQLLLFTHEREGDDWTGVSLLRAAHKPWWLKERAESVLGIAIERHGAGVPVGFLPASLRDDAAAMARLEDMLINLRVGEFSYLAFAGPDAQHAPPGEGYTFRIETPSGGGEAIRGIIEFLQYCRGEIKGAVLARFSELGHGSTGARATGQTQSEPWYDALRTIADYIGEVNSIAIKRLVDRNYPTVSRYPKLVARDIEARNLEMYAQGIAQLVAAGAVLPDKSFRGWVRDLYDAPDEDEVDDEDMGPAAGDEDPLLPTEPETPPGPGKPGKNGPARPAKPGAPAPSEGDR